MCKRTCRCGGVGIGGRGGIGLRFGGGAGGGGDSCFGGDDFGAGGGNSGGDSGVGNSGCDDGGGGRPFDIGHRFKRKICLCFCIRIMRVKKLWMLHVFNCFSGEVVATFLRMVYLQYQAIFEIEGGSLRVYGRIPHSELAEHLYNGRQLGATLNVLEDTAASRCVFCLSVSLSRGHEYLPVFISDTHC